MNREFMEKMRMLKIESIQQKSLRMLNSNNNVFKAENSLIFYKKLEI